MITAEMLRSWSLHNLLGQYADTTTAAVENDLADQDDQRNAALARRLECERDLIEAEIQRRIGG